MKEQFLGYHHPTEEEFKELWKNCTFSFDTNILLNVYRYSEGARNRLFEILEKLQERIWIPHQVAAEYYRNRLTIISEQSKPYDEIEQFLDKSLEELQQNLKKYGKRHSFTHFVDIQKIIDTIERANKRAKKMLADGQERLNSEYGDLIKSDLYLERLCELFEQKTGKQFSEQELESLYKQADKRYKQDIPPGYKDAKKEGHDKYGDYIIWRQLINYAKELKQGIIFITDDNKEDWWLKHQGKTISPRPELIQEMFTEAGVKFYMYTADGFLDYAEGFLQLEEKPEVIEEVEEVRKERNSDSDMLELERQIEEFLQGNSQQAMREIHKTLSNYNLQDLSRAMASVKPINLEKQVEELSRAMASVKPINLEKQVEELSRAMASVKPVNLEEQLSRAMASVKLINVEELSRAISNIPNIQGYNPRDISRAIENLHQQQPNEAILKAIKNIQKGYPF